jgi:hypothetical protein
MKTIQAFTILLFFSFSSFSQNFYTIKGKIIDDSNQKPIDGAYIHFADKSQGISSNSNGDFVIKFPKNYLDTTLVINAIGFEPRFDFIESITDSVFIFKLKSIANSKLGKEQFLKMNENPKFWVNQAFSEIKKLYPVNPSLLVGFYRENASINDEFAQVREAILKVERVTGTDFKEFGDKIKLMKGRSLENRINASLIRKHGFKNGFSIVTKSVESGMPVFFGDDLEDYSFKLDSNLININNRYNFVFEFKPVNKRVKAARNGKLYIDTLTNAIVRVEYALTPEGADDIFKDNSFSNVKKTGKEVVSTTNYRLHKGKWYLQDSRLTIITELENMLNHNQKVLNKLELSFVTTDITKTNGRNINFEEMLLDTEDCKKVKNFDDKFWQNYNFVIPNENLNTSASKSSDFESARR